MSTDRTYCGTPRAADSGTHATAFGWVDRRRDHGGLIFIDLRDHTGILQVVIDPNDAPEAHRAAREARLEWVLRFEGELKMRAPENVNPKRETGEVELRGDDIAGIGVNIASRIEALAQPGEVLVSRTVTDIVAGSGLDFEDRGDHSLKGVPGRWQLFAATP